MTQSKIIKCLFLIMVWIRTARGQRDWGRDYMTGGWYGMTAGGPVKFLGSLATSAVEERILYSQCDQ